MLKNIFNIVKNLIKKICMFIGVIALIVMLCAVIGARFGNSTLQIADNSYLEIDLSEDFSESAQTTLMDDFMGYENPNFMQLLKSIEFAAMDERIKGIVLKADSISTDLAQTQNLAAALQNFKNAGKKVYVYSRGFGNLGQGNREYYLASFADEIYMQPHSYIGFTGISIEVPFMKRALSKLGIEPEFYSRYEYKTAMASVTDDKMTSYYKEELSGLADGIMNELKSAVAENRKIKNIDELVNNAPLKAEQALENGLIDGVMYKNEFDNFLKNKFFNEKVEITDYASAFVNNQNKLPTIAVLTLDGVINSGTESADLSGETAIFSEDVLEQIKEISELDNLKAVVVRINSPGGEYGAADEIYFALQDLKKFRNVPLIVSQGGYAASGGYFISLAGDVIIAEPLTITGSIGVFGGKFVISDLWEKIDIDIASIKTNDNADMLSFNHKFNPKEKEIFNVSLDDVYRDFTSKVEQNRKLTKNIDEVARGRIWLGSQALELGLVDKLGGYGSAIMEARSLGNLSAEERFNIIEFPKKKDFAEKLGEFLKSGKKIETQKMIYQNVDIPYLRLFKRWQYDTILLPFEIKM